MLTGALSRLARRAFRPLNHLHLALDLHLSHPLPRGVEGAGALAGRAAVQGEWLVVLGLRFGIVLTVLVQALGGVYGSWFGTILIILVLIAQFYIVSRHIVLPTPSVPYHLTVAPSLNYTCRTYRAFLQYAR